MAEGYFDVVLTTNWDALLERALAELVQQEEYKVLIRGEIPDDLVADHLLSPIPRIKVVKLHGDIVSRILLMRDEETRSFSNKLAESLGRLLEGDVVVAGSSLQDMDLLEMLFTRAGKGGSLTFVSPRPPRPQSASELLIQRSAASAITGPDGDFDRFLATLNLEIQRLAAPANLDTRLRVEDSILAKEERGRGYINYTTISELVELFSHKVLAHKPDLLMFVNDPAAPGGMELKKRMLGHVKGVPIDEMIIKGRGRSRSWKRRVLGARRPDDEVRHVFILDAITFSGNTLRLAAKTARGWFPNAVVRIGVLVVSQHLLDTLSALAADDPVKRIVYQTVTDRFEIFFPWGVTQTTGDFQRRFMGVTEERIVQINRRPWGAIEILADEEVCSVRLLTIEADEKLSFQRHLCRDELFVALDDKIGLDVAAADLSAGTSEFDPQIKSLILEKGDYILVPRGIRHRTKASKERVRLLEVGFGVYDQVHDIERLVDTFDRLKANGSV
jgi:mannose-6-phosphate isomerase-like protein (cupin superfamily)